MKTRQMELLLVHEVATRLRVRPKTVRAWIARGQYLPHVRLGRSIRIPAAAVDRLVEGGARKRASA